MFVKFLNVFLVLAKQRYSKAKYTHIQLVKKEMKTNYIQVLIISMHAHCHQQTYKGCVGVGSLCKNLNSKIHTLAMAQWFVR